MFTMLLNTALSLLTEPAATARSKENFTLDASNASPLWNLTPGLSLKAQVLLSGVVLQLCASSGAIEPSRSILVSVSKTL